MKFYAVTRHQFSLRFAGVTLYWLTTLSKKVREKSFNRPHVKATNNSQSKQERLQIKIKATSGEKKF